jgi:hypothetical protein
MEDGSRCGEEKPTPTVGLSGSGGSGPITPMRVGLGRKRLLGQGNYDLFNPRHDLPSPGEQVCHRSCRFDGIVAVGVGRRFGWRREGGRG